ncbi:hypothetical protein JD276_04290 [Leucobacter sp. CSA1]|uniref:MmcQ/YjbR family DNA-binding protein n=1 Tax=Leucobacter chromiisoli TaxID=2796471 RepID=A0A934UTC8_9MICO|nr:hypothetical protein [Leucobacter chromiisoli]MBK0418249.1 hypothetical protein [Leucobacter chromiisoli]
MATLDDARRIALELPETFEKTEGHRGGATWRSKHGTFVWERPPSKTDLARLAESGRAWPEGDILAVLTDGLEGKEELLAALPRLFFTIPHFDGYPAVLLRLSAIDVAQLREVIAEAWLLRAPRAAAQAWLAANPAASS